MSRIYIMPDGGQVNADEYDEAVANENTDKVYLVDEYACFDGVPDGLLAIGRSLEDEVNETNRELVEARAWKRMAKYYRKFYTGELPGPFRMPDECPF